MTTPPPQYPQGEPQDARQPPPGGIPFGQQGGADAYPPPGAAFPRAGTYPPLAPPRRSKLKKAGLVVAVIAGLSILAVGFVASQDDADTAAVGDCMHQNRSDSSDPDMAVVDCSDTKAQFEVLAKIGGKFSKDEAGVKCTAQAKDFSAVYVQTGRGKNFVLCLKER